MKNKPDKHTILAWARLLKASAGLLAEVEKALKNAGLPPLNWYDVLLEVSRAGPEGLRQSDIAREVLLPKHNLSRLIDRMEAQGVVARSGCGSDGRAKQVSLTDSGNELLRKMWQVYGAEIQARMGEPLTEGQQHTLAEIAGVLLAQQEKG
ncbi:MAG: MarR family winged helix-turn-helix transcriptional regulator [Alcanivorax sp.]|uniref:MarR family winged helix-turn-helix transcriptional regulator n=1 Tax=Alcanivorax sp. TaxID=1872427 RepID=UPI003DA6FFCB